MTEPTPPPTEEERWRAFKEAMVAPLIAERHALYQSTANPIHAFAAYRISRAAKLPPPPWMLELLDRWAEVLCVERPRGKAAIADALGLGKRAGPSITARAETDVRDLLLCQRVHELTAGDPRDQASLRRIEEQLGTRAKVIEKLTLEQAFAEAGGEYNLDTDSVRNIWYRVTS